METNTETGATVIPRPVLAGKFLDQTPGIDIIGEREGGLVECFIDIDLINTEDVAVNRPHVKALADSITDERQRNHTESGQLTPILLGLVDGEEKLSIIDGFHRTAALKEAGDSTVYATIRPSTREDVIDLRILTARTHKAVQFARVVEWVTESWDRTEWSKQISSVQAFMLYQTGSGRNLGVRDSVPEIRSWVQHKCEQWQMPATSIRSILSTAVVADPTLVQEARQQNNGRALDYITPSHLTVIALGLPNKFDIQRFVADKSKKHNLRVPQTRFLVSVLGEAENLEDAERAIRSLDLSSLPSMLAQKEKSNTGEASMSDQDKVVTVLRPPETALTLDNDGVLGALARALGNTRLVLTKIHNGTIQVSKNELIVARNDLRKMAEVTVRLAIEANKLAVSQPEARSSTIQTEDSKTGDDSESLLNPSESQGIAAATEVADLKRPVYDKDNPIIDYLLGGINFPIIETMEDVRFIERLIKQPPRGSNTQRIEDIREAAHEVVRAHKRNL